MPSARVWPRGITWRTIRQWFLRLFLLVCLAQLAFYIVIQIEFEVPVNLNRPKRLRQHKEIVPWVDDKHLEIRLPSARALPGPAQSNNASQTGDAESRNGHDLSEEIESRRFMGQQATIQRDRQRHLAEACRRHPELSQGSLGRDTLRHIYVQERHKLLYCFVPKVGCSNWKRVLMVLGGLRKRTSGISFSEAHFRNGMKRLSALSPSEQRLRLDTYTKFMFARQPFLRILSAYRNKFADIKVYREEPYFQSIAKRKIKRYRPNATPRELQTGENITWHEWVTYLTNPKEKAGFDDHWQEIYKMCSPCKVMYDYLGKLETIADDARYMLMSLGLQDKVSYPAKTNSHPTNSSKTYDIFFSQITKASVRKLWEIYKLDFELFGYPKPSVV